MSNSKVLSLKYQISRLDQHPATTLGIFAKLRLEHIFGILTMLGRVVSRAEIDILLEWGAFAPFTLLAMPLGPR